jgi:hypothetical protein
LTFDNKLMCLTETRGDTRCIALVPVPHAHADKAHGNIGASFLARSARVRYEMVVFGAVYKI